MSFQAYLDTIKAKTGLDPAEFRALAEKKGLLADDVKTGQIVSWLAEDFGLGRGHAMALVATMKQVAGATADPADMLEKFFGGPRAHWRASYEALLDSASTFGRVGVAFTNSYISLLKGKSKFAVVAVTADRLDVGVKLKGTDATARFEAAGAWNSMVTHRVRITDPTQVDTELLDWLRRAYEAA